MNKNQMKKKIKIMKESFTRKESMSDEARELQLFIENDGDLYRQRQAPIQKNLSSKMKKGNYDPVKAIKLWMYLVNDGARKYVKEFGGDVRTMFPKNVREEVAKEMARDWYNKNNSMAESMREVEDTFRNTEELKKYLRNGGKLQDVITVDNIIYTLDSYDRQGKEITFGNKKHNKGLILETEDRYKKGFSDVEIEVDNDPLLRNDIEYEESMREVEDTFRNTEELKKYLRNGGKLQDVITVDNIIYTLDSYDRQGKEITFGNKKHNKGLILETEDRYKKGFSDVEIEVDNDPLLRNDIEYEESMREDYINSEEEWVQNAVKDLIVRSDPDKTEEEIQEEMELIEATDGDNRTHGRGRKVEVDGEEFLIYENYDDAERSAIEDVEELMQEDPNMFDKDFMRRHVYVSDIDKRIIAGEKADYRVEDEEFDSDEERDDKIQEIYDEVYKKLDQDPLDYAEELGYGNNDLPSWIQYDTKEAAEEAVSIDGAALFLASYDSEEIELPSGAYAYRVN